MKRNSTEQSTERVINKSKSEITDWMRHPHSIVTEYQLLTHHYLLNKELNSHSAASMKQSTLMKQFTSTKQSALMKQFVSTKQAAFTESFFWVSNQVNYILLLLWQQEHHHFLFLHALLQIIYKYRGSSVIPVVWLDVLG